MAEKKKITAKKTVRKKKPVTKVEEKKIAAPQPEVAVVAEAPAPKKPVVTAPREKKVKLAKPAKGVRYHGTGRRKESVAKVWLQSGSGKILLNGRNYSDYFCGRKLLEFQVTRPLAVTNTAASYDVYADVFGGGVNGQAGAVSLGIARALLELSPDYRIKLKREGLLRRDPRMKERKKYGHKRARKSFQYSKR